MINLSKWSERSENTPDSEEFNTPSSENRETLRERRFMPKRTWIDDIPFPDNNSSSIGWFKQENSLWNQRKSIT
jgi:hypothetical protein